MNVKIVIVKTAIEVDTEMLQILKSLFPKAIEENKLVLIQGSVLDVQLPHFTKCVANIPYYVENRLEILIS